jgi:hypothetical protein
MNTIDPELGRPSITRKGDWRINSHHALPILFVACSIALLASSQSRAQDDCNKTCTNFFYLGCLETFGVKAYPKVGKVVDQNGTDFTGQLNGSELNTLMGQARKLIDDFIKKQNLKGKGGGDGALCDNTCYCDSGDPVWTPKQHQDADAIKKKVKGGGDPTVDEKKLIQAKTLKAPTNLPPPAGAKGPLELQVTIHLIGPPAAMAGTCVSPNDF